MVLLACWLMVYGLLVKEVNFLWTELMVYGLLVYAGLLYTRAYMKTSGLQLGCI